MTMKPFHGETVSQPHPAARHQTDWADIAQQLWQNRTVACALNPIVAMSDPKRTPDVLAFARNLPNGSALIYRHFGQGNLATAQALRQICFERECQFLLGKDWRLAAEAGADGVHLPQVDIEKAHRLRDRFPDWIISAAVHDPEHIEKANHQPLDTVILSPLFASPYKDGTPALGVVAFKHLMRTSTHPVFALGGVNAGTIDQALTIPIAGIAAVSAFT